MASLWLFFEVFFYLLLVAALGSVAAIVFEANRRRLNHSHVEAPAVFEDPNSSTQGSCPSIFDPAEKYLSLIIPAYNEEQRLPGALQETIDYLQDRASKDKSFSYEVVIVDDGSRDGTKRVGSEFSKKFSVDNVRVILLGRNHGKGEAIRKGMLHSRGELLLMLDADGATKVNDLEKLENQIHAFAEKESSGSSYRVSDIPVAAFGSRAHLEEKALATRKMYRNFLMKGFHLVVLLTAGSGIRDTQCGFKMFTRSAARKLFSNIRLKRSVYAHVDYSNWIPIYSMIPWLQEMAMDFILQLSSLIGFESESSKEAYFRDPKPLSTRPLRRWCFDVEIVYLCKRFHIPMAEISVKWSEIPGSKVNPLSIPNMLWELALMSMGYRTGMWRVHT